MQLTSETFAHEGALPWRCGFGVPDPEARVAPGGNLNPALSWSARPDGTRSFVLLCHDDDAPRSVTNVNRPNKQITLRARRRTFFHWVLVDIAADAVGIQEGEFSDGVTPRGKPGPNGPRNTRQGLNDYTGWFADDAEMAGRYFGYDGPCPPWNDALIHRYHFTLYALSIGRCPVGEDFTGADVQRGLGAHVLAECRITATYSLNPELVAA